MLNFITKLNFGFIVVYLSLLLTTIFGIINPDSLQISICILGTIIYFYNFYIEFRPILINQNGQNKNN